MPNTTLFILIFASQIWLLSFYFPRQLAARISYMLEHFPASDYPNLYPESPNKVKNIRRFFLLLNYAFAVVGIVLLCKYSLFDNSFQQSGRYYEHIPLFLGMLQFIPLVYLELAGRHQLKLMRVTDKRTNRAATLTPRNLFNFVSPWLLYTAIAVYIGFVSFELYVTGGEFTEKLVIKLSSITLTNLLFIYIARCHLYGKKLDPYQATADRDRITRNTILSLVAISIFVTLFCIAQTLVNTYEQSYLEIIINSLYFQIIATFSFINITRGINIKELDLSVYKSTN